MNLETAINILSEDQQHLYDSIDLKAELLLLALRGTEKYREEIINDAKKH